MTSDNSRGPIMSQARPSKCSTLLSSVPSHHHGLEAGIPLHVHVKPIHSGEDAREPEVDVVPWRVVASLRRLGGRGRIEMAFAMWRDMRDMIERSVRTAHGDWDEARIRREVARRMSGDAA